MRYITTRFVVGVKRVRVHTPPVRYVITRTNHGLLWAVSAQHHSGLSANNNNNNKSKKKTRKLHTDGRMGCYVNTGVRVLVCI